MADVPYVKLNNGVSMPQLGLGVWQASNQEAEKAVTMALETGYRLIDTAAKYNNEVGVGRAIANSDVPREDIFVTTKLWNSEHGYGKTTAAFERSLQLLGLDYIDLYLIHWPVPAQNRYMEAWKELESLYAQNRVRAIGVCNFMPDQLQELLDQGRDVPVINQIELHPNMQQRKIRDFCLEHDIQVESWSPLKRGGELLEDRTITHIAHKHHKTPAQVIIRWHLQSNLVVIPKSVHENRIKENFEVFDFELDERDMRTINQLDIGARIGPDPRTANFM